MEMNIMGFIIGWMLYDALKALFQAFVTPKKFHVEPLSFREKSGTHGT